jgi:hypothetical protein
VVGAGVGEGEAGGGGAAAGAEAALEGAHVEQSAIIANTDAARRSVERVVFTNTSGAFPVPYRYGATDQ